MRLLLIVAVIGSLFPLSLRAQQINSPCGTTQMVNAAYQNNPSLRINQDELEHFTRDFIPEDAGRSVTKIIPIVFHVIHNYGAENISKNQILDAMRILNEDFKLLNADRSQVVAGFSSIIGNCDFEFRLARKDPNGNCTEGITRTVSTLTYEGNDNVKQLISWPRNKYLNVWVTDRVFVDNLGGVGGYAYLPGSAPSATVDGIIVSHVQLGSIGTSGGSNFAARTLTHEVGHWFNLKHTWGDNPQPGIATNCNDEDGVSDTPPTVGVADQSCNLTQSTCDVLNNVQNYMDYSACARMFTARQVVRMQAACNSIIAGRNNLWSPSNLNATGLNGTPPNCAPIADFKSDFSDGCTNIDFQYSDLSYNSTVNSFWTWNWTFPGGTPSTSNLQNPIVRYAQPGNYSAQLTVTNSTGSSTKSKPNAVVVSPLISNILSPIIQDFEDVNFPVTSSLASYCWNYEGATGAFTRTTSASVSGVASLKYNNSLISDGTSSSVISPAVNYSGIASPANVIFKLAYAQRVSSNQDKLEVWTSSNCGKSWVRRYSKSGTALSTASARTGTFIPTAGEWRTESVNVGLLVGARSGLVKFTVIDDSGNDLYIEDVNLVSAAVGMDDPSLDDQLTAIFPNPGQGDALLTYSLLKAVKTSVLIMDVAGRIIGKKELGVLSPGDHQLHLQDITGSSLVPGLYLIQIEAGNSVSFKKWVCN
jgi:PKD repeat protein